MWITKDKNFLYEQKRFNLKSFCESCRYFKAEDKKCAMLYPVSSHLTETFLKTEEGGRIFFCKMFEPNTD